MKVEATLPADLARLVREIEYATGWPPSRIVRVALRHYAEKCNREQPRLPGTVKIERPRRPGEPETQDELFDDYEGAIEGELF